MLLFRICLQEALGALLSTCTWPQELALSSQVHLTSSGLHLEAVLASILLYSIYMKYMLLGKLLMPISNPGSTFGTWEHMYLNIWGMNCFPRYFWEALASIWRPLFSTFLPFKLETWNSHWRCNLSRWFWIWPRLWPRPPFRGRFWPFSLSLTLDTWNSHYGGNFWWRFQIWPQISSWPLWKGHFSHHCDQLWPAVTSCDQLM